MVLPQHFWGEVSRRPCEPEPCLLLPFYLYGQAKVRQLHCCALELGGQQQILRLQVPVHHTHLMAVQHGLQDLLDTVAGISLTVILPGHDVLKQLPTSNQVEDQVMMSLLRDAVVKPDDVGVFQQAADASFALQLLMVSG